MSVGARCILLFEGLFLFRRGIDAYWDYRILLDVDPETALSRALARDTIDPPDVTRRKYALRYDAAWEIYERKENPEAKAGVIVDNRDVNQPFLKSE